MLRARRDRRHDRNPRYFRSRSPLCRRLDDGRSTRRRRRRPARRRESPVPADCGRTVSRSGTPLDVGCPSGRLPRLPLGESRAQARTRSSLAESALTLCSHDAQALQGLARGARRPHRRPRGGCGVGLSHFPVRRGGRARLRVRPDLHQHRPRRHSAGREPALHVALDPVDPRRLRTLLRLGHQRTTRKVATPREGRASGLRRRLAEEGDPPPARRQLSLAERLLPALQRLRRSLEETAEVARRRAARASRTGRAALPQRRLLDLRDPGRVHSARCIPRSRRFHLQELVPLQRSLLRP